MVAANIAIFGETCFLYCFKMGIAVLIQLQSDIQQGE